MKLEIEDNNGNTVGEVHESFSIKGDMPFKQKERIRSLMRSSKRFHMDVGVPERPDETEEQVTPGENVDDFPVHKAIPRLKIAIERMTPYHGNIIEQSDTEIRTVKNKSQVPDKYEAKKATQNQYYYEIDKDDENNEGDKEILEIRDYYRVYVSSPENVPNDHTAIYDESHDSEEHYYEIPFKARTRINVSESDIDTEKVMEKDVDPMLSWTDRQKAGICKPDERKMIEVINAIDEGRPVWGETDYIDKNILTTINCPTTLLTLYKLFDEAENEYKAYKHHIQREISNRGIKSVDKIRKQRRILNPEDRTE